MPNSKRKTWLVYVCGIIIMICIMLLVWFYFAQRISQVNESGF